MAFIITWVFTCIHKYYKSLFSVILIRKNKSNEVKSRYFQTQKKNFYGVIHNQKLLSHSAQYLGNHRSWQLAFVYLFAWWTRRYWSALIPEASPHLPVLKEWFAAAHTGCEPGDKTVVSMHWENSENLQHIA